MDELTQQLSGKRIAIYSAETIPSFAGSGRHAFQLAKYFLSKKAYAKVICYNYRGNLPYSELNKNVLIKRLYYSNLNLVTKILSFPFLLIGYLRHLINSDIILIYGRYLIGFQFIVLFGRLFNKKVVFRSTLLGCDDAEGIKKKQRLLWGFNQYVFRQLSCYWALNSAFELKWKKYIGTNVPVMLNVQGVERFATDKEMISKKAEEVLKLLSVGILIKRKGYLEIFEALAKLETPFIYTVVGQFRPDLAHRSSKIEQEEMELIYTTGKELLGDRINFVGTIENVQEYYQNNHWLLHAATAEGVPNAILEAMSAGLPVICREIEGLGEDILKHGMNCMQFGSSADLLKVLKNEAVDEGLRKELSKNAQNTIERCIFDKVIADLMVCLYSEKK